MSQSHPDRRQRERRLGTPGARPGLDYTSHRAAAVQAPAARLAGSPASCMPGAAEMGIGQSQKPGLEILSLLLEISGRTSPVTPRGFHFLITNGDRSNPLCQAVPWGTVMLTELGKTREWIP
jgi:hypothetical protein